MNSTERNWALDMAEFILLDSDATYDVKKKALNFVIASTERADVNKVSPTIIMDIFDKITCPKPEKIQAIKLYRQATGQELKESKEAVEKLIKKINETYVKIRRQTIDGIDKR